MNQYPQYWMRQLHWATVSTTTAHNRTLEVHALQHAHTRFLSNGAHFCIPILGIHHMRFHMHNCRKSRALKMALSAFKKKVKGVSVTSSTPAFCSWRSRGYSSKRDKLRWQPASLHRPASSCNIYIFPYWENHRDCSQSLFPSRKKYRLCYDHIWNLVWWFINPMNPWIIKDCVSSWNIWPTPCKECNQKHWLRSEKIIKVENDQLCLFPKRWWNLNVMKNHRNILLFT